MRFLRYLQPGLFVLVLASMNCAAVVAAPSDDVAATFNHYVPIDFTIGPPGAAPTVTRFLMNQTLVKTAKGWVIASILPIPAVPATSATPTPK